MKFRMLGWFFSLGLEIGVILEDSGIIFGGDVAEGG